MVFLFIILSFVAYYLLLGIASLLGLTIKSGDTDQIVILLIILIGLAININYKIGLQRKNNKNTK